MTHLLTRIDCGPGPVLYFARCGYRSAKRKEFRVLGWAVMVAGVDCETCLKNIKTKEGMNNEISNTYRIGFHRG